MRVVEDRVRKRLKVMGLDIAIEYPSGTVKHGKNKKTGKAWQREYSTDYGFIEGHTGADGEEVDCFVSAEPDADADVYVIHQMTPDGSEFDEDKCMIGYASEDDAVADFKRHVHEPDEMFGGCTVMDQDEFKKRLKRADGETLADEGAIVAEGAGKRIEFRSWDEVDRWRSFIGPTVASMYSVKARVGHRMITEGLSTGDLEDILVPRVSIDEYVAKDGGDNVVVAFFVYNVPEAVEPLRRFCDRCPGVIETDSGDSDTLKNTSIVYCEFPRASIMPEKVSRMIELVARISKVDPDDMTLLLPNADQPYPFSREAVDAYFSKITKARTLAATA